MPLPLATGEGGLGSPCSAGAVGCQRNLVFGACRTWRIWALEAFFVAGGRNANGTVEMGVRARFDSKCGRSVGVGGRRFLPVFGSLPIRCCLA